MAGPTYPSIFRLIIFSFLVTVYKVCVQHQMRVEMRKMERSKSIIEEEKMERLELSGLALEVVPNPAINLAFISHLNISNNNLESIPESLTARMVNLVSLDVHSNQLKCIPNSIGCLSKLKLLDVSGNMLDSFPNTIENCRTLEELNANFNKLTKLPDTMGLELKSIKKLSINSNKLVFLPSSLSHMTTLRVLDARLNCLRALPKDLENLLNLQVLNVSQNFHHLTTLPFSVGLLLSLVELDVSYNSLAILPNSIGCLKHLQKLHVEGNPLVSPPMEIAQQKLEVVKGYLCDLINSGKSEAGPTTKKKWLGNLVRNKTFSGRLYNEARDKEAALLSDNCHHHSVDDLPASRYPSFSPRRFFSFKAPLGR